MEKTVLVETSARHVHVSQEALETLFGAGYELTKKKDLSQPGQFACEERVQVIGEKSSFPAVSILGPVRPDCQVEISASDARAIGVKAPVRESGDIAGSGACKLVGPKGEVELKEGVIIAKRHIHMTPEDAEKYGLKDKQVVSVKIESAERSLIFGDTVVRVSPKFSLAMHIDTDEANAVLAPAGVMGIILD
ncbi:MAG: phosphate propanoyltransferase [Clostridia bacterium]|nr:phosphate propanoyltransferase [Clostridia bacterium]